MEILRDTAWQFIFGLLGVGIAVLIYFLQRRKKSLSYQIVSESPLLTVKEGLEGNIKILFGEKLVPNVHLIVLKIINDGNVPILSSDFHDALQFSFGQKTTVLSAEVMEALPKTFRPVIDVESDRIILQRTLLNGGDEVSVKLLLAGYNNTIECNAHIVGVKDVKRTNESFNISRMYSSMGIVLLITGFTSLFLLFKDWSTYQIREVFTRPIFIFLLGFFMILLFIGLALGVLGVSTRIKRSPK